jgi:hypothetical protein
MKPPSKPDDNARAQRGERVRDPEEGAKSKRAGKTKKNKGPSQAQVLMDLAEQTAEFFQVPRDNRAAYATFPWESHSETWRVDSSRFSGFLGDLYRQREGRWPTMAALAEAVATLAMKTAIGAPERELFLRVAAHAGSVYLDLCDAEWRVVHVPPGGKWRVIDSAKVPVRFDRSAAMGPLPVPVNGGSIEELRQFLNAGRDDDWRLMLSWLLFTFQTKGPFPVLVIQGEQGSAKSTTCRFLRAMIDPSELDVRTLPKNEEDLMVAARRSWILSFDNLSGLQAWLSDAICRLASGAAFGTRKFHSNTDEVFIRAIRAVMLNGIDDMTSRSDLGRRAVRIDLPPIPEAGYREEQTLKDAFEAALPRMLSALLGLLSGVLERRPNVRVPGGLTSMGDFETWAVAVEEAAGWPAGAVLRPYRRRVEQAISETLEGDPVAMALMALVEHRVRRGELDGDLLWDDTSGALLAALEPFVPGVSTGASDAVIRQAIEKWRRRWPKTPTSLGKWLMRNAPALRSERRIDVRQADRNSNARGWTIRIVGPPPTNPPEAPARASRASSVSEPHGTRGIRNDVSEGWSAADDASASLDMTLDDANVTHQGANSFATVGDGSDADDASIFFGDRKP